MKSNVGLWDGWYPAEMAPHPFGTVDSYQLGAEWLQDCALVEDWGCGAGYLTRYIEPERYIGVDGSDTPFAQVTADLAHYRSRVPGLFMRHVLEHNWQWAQILDNALHSFTERMFLVLFVPLSEGETHDTEFETPPGVPNLSFKLEDLTDRMGGLLTEVTELHNRMPYGLRTPKLVGSETVFRLER